jgi:hypothetical protein
MSPFQLRLPAMVMRIDEARRYNLVRAINNLNTLLTLDILRDLSYLSVLDQDRGLRWNDVIVRIVDEYGTVRKNNRFRGGHVGV